MKVLLEGEKNRYRDASFVIRNLQTEKGTLKEDFDNACKRVEVEGKKKKIFLCGEIFFFFFAVKNSEKFKSKIRSAEEEIFSLQSKLEKYGTFSSMGEGLSLSDYKMLYESQKVKKKKKKFF